MKPRDARAWHRRAGVRVSLKAPMERTRAGWRGCLMGGRLGEKALKARGTLARRVLDLRSAMMIRARSGVGLATMFLGALGL